MQTALEFYCEQTNCKESELDAHDLFNIKLMNKYALHCTEKLQEIVLRIIETEMEKPLIND